MFKIRSQLPTGPKAIKEHILKLSQLTSAKEHQELFSHLYSCLSILDSKSASLLQFNSIIIAVFAIFMSAELSWYGWLIVNTGMAAILASALLLLSVVWVHWSTTADLINLEQHAVVLLSVRRARTIRYRIAWLFSVVSLLALALFLLLRFILHIKKFYSI